jgi:hypothetical protein
VDGKGNRLGDIIIKSGSFTLVRDDYSRLKNVFSGLSKINPNNDFDQQFVRLLGQLIEENQGKNGILKITYFLDGWLFSNSATSNAPTISQLDRFRELPRKRLWMFVMFLRRDPCIRNLFREALLQIFGNERGQILFEKWSDDSAFDPKDIELPGDMWNARLFKALLANIGDFEKQKPKQLAREIASRYSILPSTLDVTFELGANKCIQKSVCGLPLR